MSDPLERLRGFDLKAEAPDSQRIRERARQIQVRRYQMAGGLAALLVLIASAALFRPSADRRDVALPRTSPAPQVETPALGTVGEELSVHSSSDQLQSPPAQLDQQSGTASAPMRAGAGGTSASTLRAELELSRETTSPAAPVILRLKVCNDGSSGVTVSFPTSQRYDFEIHDSGGDLIWRWGATRAFEQVTGSETFSPGCKVVAEESWNGTNQQGQPVRGSYKAFGILTSSPNYRSPQKNVCAFMC